MTAVPSKIFAGFRALGFVSNHVPLVTRYNNRHRENYVITCVGKAFHVYNVSRLGIVAVSDSHPEDINVIVVDRRYVFTAAGCDIFAVERNKKLSMTYKGHKSEVALLLPIGHHLVSIDIDGCLIVWHTPSAEQYMSTTFDPSAFRVTAMGHPTTYINKILLGSYQGTLQLWNINKNRLIYSYAGWGSPVTAIEQSTATNIMAIGLADGHIYLHNLETDETSVKLKQDYGPVTKIGFRSDGHPIMVTGSTAGHIAVWDLKKKKLHSYHKKAHDTSVTGLTCLPSEPIMVTSAADNSLKVWIFDLPDGGVRLLRQRCGHSAPPTSIRFYGKDGHNILSAGQDSTVRSFSTVHDKHNKSLGRASYHKKESKKQGLKFDKHVMPPVVKFAAEPSRESDWDNILACHHSINQVTAWSYQRSTMGNHKYSNPRHENDIYQQEDIASAVEISPCGNFGFIGYSSGEMDVYNMQSGLHRGSFGGKQGTAHNGSIRGIACDSLNQKVITAGGDLYIKFWRFKSRQLIESVEIESFISQIVLHRESSLLAVALDDFSISIIDIDTRKQVRHFHGHSAAVSDMTFSADGRWLISSSMDCTIRTWNMPTGRLIDAFSVNSAVTSLSMSPCGNFMATAHVGDVGIYLWSNRTLYSFVSLKPLSEDYVPRLADLPGTTANDTGDENSQEEDDADDEYKSPEQIADELVSLSLLPTSRWLNLLNLDVIKMRNKPKEPPKAPKAAPFFLPTIAGLQPKFDHTQNTEDDETSSHIKRPALDALSDLSMALTRCHQSGQYDAVLKRLKGLGPSAIDADIRTLSSENGGSEEVMQYFLEFIQATLRTNLNFELAHSYLALFLKVHGEEISAKPTISAALEELSQTQFESWERVRLLLQKSLGMVNYLRSAAI